jgi:hypothetical protein
MAMTTDATFSTVDVAEDPLADHGDSLDYPENTLVPLITRS